MVLNGVTPLEERMLENTTISPEYLEMMEKKLADLERQIRRLEYLEAWIPNTNLLSPSFLSRAFTVWGHLIVAQLLITIPIYCLLFILQGL